MGFRKKIQYFLVHTGKYTNKQALELIVEKKVIVNGRVIEENTELDQHAEVAVNGQILRVSAKLRYLAFHKPKGYISSMNTSVENNISVFFDEPHGLSIAGRLDKDSEGLLLLSNDGKWVEKLCHPKYEKEKMYEVEINPNADEEFMSRIANGLILKDGTVTKPCQCTSSGKNAVHIALKEGKYRQIRRMCHVLNRHVLGLKRIKIGSIELADLAPGEYRSLNTNELG